MDPEFMTRYLSEDGDGSGEAEGGAPASQPDVGETPSIGEPGADIAGAGREDLATMAADGGSVRLSPGPQTARAPEPSASSAQAEPPASSSAQPQGLSTASVWASGAAERSAAEGPPSQGAAAQRVDTGPQRLAPGVAAPRHSGRAAHDEPSGLAASGWTPGTVAGHFRPDELVKKRTVPPEMGWRKAVYATSGHLVNLGAGPAERTLRDQISLIASNFPGNYSIAFVSIKGGVGKTRTTSGVGTVYAMHRTEPVLALDANPTYGSLGRVIDPMATASIREFVSDEQVTTYPKARRYTGKNRQGLEVLAGNQNVANPLRLSDQLFVDTLNSAQRFYQLTLIDCGNHIEHPVMRGVLGSVDALVIVGTMNYDGAEAAERTINWLSVRNLGDLLGRSALVFNDVNHCYNVDFVTKVRERLEPRVGAVKLIPFDKHLRDGAELDFGALRRRTQLAYIDLAAWLAQGFTTAKAGLR